MSLELYSPNLRHPSLPYGEKTIEKKQKTRTIHISGWQLGESGVQSSEVGGTQSRELKMGLLDSFEVLPYVTGVPTMSVTKDGINFNKTVVEKLCSPAFVVVLVDKTNLKLALTPCDEKAQGARPFLRDGRSARAGVRWNNTDLKDSIQTITGWDLEDKGRKVGGRYYPEDNALIFDLTTWTPIERRSTAAD
ncbi:hypothetical protein BTIS_1420 [Bifidobacterium tissieri]|uniref:Uncharacterized protein n=3 Tax=Bifidobacterium TaxID=1678 RepID=A0A261FEM8_9BIFI|nr:hypothetical protein BTIS_1420 [Bifidobacterium tissieri]